VIWPHCGTVGSRVYDLAAVRGKPSIKNSEGAIRYVQQAVRRKGWYGVR
jgi:hypothetical protein